MNFHINESEYRLMDILLDAAPINSMKLVALCQEQLGWKKSTTYTVLRGLREKQLVKNEQATVDTLVSRSDLEGHESRAFLDKKFHGSLPAFVAAFLRQEKLTQEEAQKLQALIDQAAKEEEV